MGFSLFPRTVKFFELFKDQNRKLLKASLLVERIFQHMHLESAQTGHAQTDHAKMAPQELRGHIFEERHEVLDMCGQVHLIEAEGNDISRTIAKELSQTFITPIDREDIHDLNLGQEMLLNQLKDIATRVGAYEFERARYPAVRLTANLRLMVEEIRKLLEALSARKEDGESMSRLKALKYECDMLLLSAMGEMYECESCDYQGILSIVKWSHVYDRIEQAANAAERLANVLEGIMLKNA